MTTILTTTAERNVRPTSMWHHSRFRIRRPFWSFVLRRALLLDAQRILRVFTPDGHLVMFLEHAMFHFREEVTVFADEGRAVPLFRIKARSLATVNITFDIADVASGQLLVSAQIRGARSIVHDRFLIMDADENQIGTMEETGASFLRRILPFTLSRHHMVVHGQEVARLRQLFRFVSREFEVEIESSQVDPRFILVCSLLALMARARREDD